MKDFQTTTYLSEYLVLLSDKIKLLSDEWIDSRTQLPVDGQKVIYYFEPVGAHKGIFTREELPEEALGIKGIFGDCFSCEYGFLCDEDVFWIPYEDII